MQHFESYLQKLAQNLLLLLLSTRKPRFRRKYPTVNFWRACKCPKSVSISLFFSHIFAPFFTARMYRCFQPLEIQTWTKSSGILSVVFIVSYQTFSVHDFAAIKIHARFPVKSVQKVIKKWKCCYLPPCWFSLVRLHSCFVNLWIFTTEIDRVQFKKNVLLVANQDRVFFYVYCQGIKSLKRFCPKHICAEINAVMPHIMKGYFIAVKYNSFGQVSLSIISWLLFLCQECF